MNLAAFFAIGAGAALGAWARWGLGLLLNPLLVAIPLGTLAANLIGGYLIGVALGVFHQYTHLAPELKLFIITGFLGGLTTFSSFSGEVMERFLAQQYAWAFSAMKQEYMISISNGENILPKQKQKPTGKNS